MEELDPLPLSRNPVLQKLQKELWAPLDEEFDAKKVIEYSSKNKN